MVTIYFRVDGNSHIATGHLMRCLAIARACVQAGRHHGKDVTISFLVSDDTSRTLLIERFESPAEFIVHSLNSDYRHMEAEVPTLLTHLNDKDNLRENHSDNTAFEKPWLFIDSYYASPDYFHMLLDHFRIAYLDDLKSFDCPVDLVINYDSDQDCSHYTKAAHKLLGMQYTPLRAQFQSPAYTVRPEVAHVLLSTGGTDPFGVAECILHIIYEDPDYPDRIHTHTDSHPISSLDINRLQSLHYHIITSKANTRYNCLVDMAHKNSHIHIHENVTDMVSLMASCDMAVSAGGTTLSELSAVGVPTISYLMADNQCTAVNCFAVGGIIPCAGDIRPVQTPDTTILSPDHIKRIESASLLPASVLYNILSFMTHMSYDAEARQKSSYTMRAFLDGRGAGRIAEALLSS